MVGVGEENKRLKIEKIKLENYYISKIKLVFSKKYIQKI